MYNEVMPLSFRETFKYVINARNSPEMSYLHYVYIRQMAFEDLEFLCSNAIPIMIAYLKVQERLDITILALKISEYILNPKHDFKVTYVEANPHKSLIVNEILSNF